MPDALLVLFLLAGAGALLWFVGTPGISYDFRPTGLHIGLGLPLAGRFIPYDQIVDVRRPSRLESFLSRRYGALGKSGLLLELDRGLNRWIIVTPPVPDAFLAELQRRLAR
ncbi:MAG TPA: hypothetical protein VFS33_11475 [Gemmatimonadales bacterium]|nr:hypothetical protein [Gemmatimonadales bacterium]